MTRAPHLADRLHDAPLALHVAEDDEAHPAPADRRLDAREVEAFAAADPYGQAGLVTESRIEPWTVVANRPFDEPVG